MAVQAQYPTNAFSPVYRSWMQGGNVLEGFQMMQNHQHQMSHLLPSLGKATIVGDSGQQAAGLPNQSVFSDHPHSELTCNVSGSRKRIRDELLTLAAPAAVFPQLLRVQDPAFMATSIALKSGSVGAVKSAFPVTCEQRPRVFNTTATSTSGRQPIIFSPSAPASASTTLSQELLAHICNQNFETDALIRLQSERLRLTMEEARKRHCKSLLSILEQRVAKKFREKDFELENVNRKNAELEEKINQISAENQVWFNLAKNNEAIASNLRTNLEQVLLENCADALVAPLREGYGDSDGTPFPADDAHSYCFEDKVPKSTPVANAVCEESVGTRHWMACKVCGGHDVCVLVLPCRHLCLCKDCEATVSTCPLCNFPKKACLRIFMS